MTQFYPSISIDTSSPSIAFARTQDNGSPSALRAAFPGWIITAAEWRLDGRGRCRPKHGLYRLRYGYPVNAAYQTAPLAPFRRPSMALILPTLQTSYLLWPLAPIRPLLYFGTTKIYQSLDAANTWTALTGPPCSPFQEMADSNRGRAGEFHVVYTGSSGGGVFAAQTATTQSAFFQVGEFPIAPRAVTGIAIDPSDPTGNTAYVALLGFSFNGTDPLGYTVMDLKGHIFKTVNANSAPNATFQDVSC